MKAIQVIDRFWWLVILAVAGVLFIGFWFTSSQHFSYLGRLDKAGRSSLYSALTGASSGLLGFSFAAISILIAVPRKPSIRFVSARRQTVAVLLSTSGLVGAVLVLSVLGMIVDNGRHAPDLLAAGLISLLISSLIGFVISGISLSVLLRTTQ